MASADCNLSVERIVSGGQTGVDQAALDVAMKLDLAHGGWCPRGRRCESGHIPFRFQLAESHSSKYWVRTEQNVVDSDGTLILCRGRLTGGTAFTERMAVKHRRPCHLAQLPHSPADVEATLNWLVLEQIRTLNVAGPRESTSPGIGSLAEAFLFSVFRPEC